MPSSSSSSASSSAGSSPSSSPPPENTGKHSLKRKRGQAADPVSDSESSSSEEENEVEVRKNPAARDEDNIHVETSRRTKNPFCRMLLNANRRKS